MALQSSGKLTLNEIATEFGGTAPHGLKEYYDAASGIPSSGTISILDFYGASSVYNLEDEVTPTTINGQKTLKEITISDYISSGETFEIPSDWWIFSDNTSNPAILVDIACTIINNGKIIGKGGNGGSGSAGGRIGYAAGHAVSITATGVTITNNSGAYIAGGGGGGAGTAGGGGAGGGNGSVGPINSPAGGTGGVVNASGGNGTGANAGNGGTAGGTGGGYTQNPYTGGGGGGGGRILPGSTTYPNGVSAGPNSYFGGSGGGPNQAGDAAQASGLGYAHGGGGWGAKGGSTYGGAAGKAVSTSQSYTLSNSGTIYGAS